MTTTTATPGDDENAEAVLQAASDVIESAQENARIEIVMMKALRIGSMLLPWRKMMVDGGFSPEWVEAAATDIFHGFFPPYESEHCMIHNYE